MSNGPFFFAWVRPDQTIFDEATMLVEDEDIFDFVLKHDEGQFATLNLAIRNPRIGLLNAGRKLWAWFAYKDRTAHIRPLFFGVLTSIPTDMFQELVELTFNARPQDFILAKQTAAERLKVRPFYDPVFLDDTHRDDPDAILEGWSKLYHIDRLTHAVTVSDILEGEDGTITFDETMGIYDTVKMELGEAPLSIVQVQAAVQWTQRCTETLPTPIQINVASYTGGSFKSDWPKPGSELGGGWQCEASYVTDVLGTEHAKSTSNSSSLTFTDPNMLDCSTESMSMSVTSCPVPGITVDSHVESQTGLCDPFGWPPGAEEAAADSYAKAVAAWSQASQEAAAKGQKQPSPPDTPLPPGYTIPATLNSNGSLALIWQLNCEMFLRYNAKREFSEQVTINVQANVQDTVVSPTVDQHTEVMKVSGANVGLPLLSVNAWTDYAGSHVNIGTLMLPNDRTQIGGQAYQICTIAGTAGVTEPVFSDIPGGVTIDGTVQWASLGDATPSQQPTWTDSTPVATGSIVLYEPKIWSDAAGAFETTGQSCFLIAIQGGTTNQSWIDFTYTPAATSNDDELPLPINTAYINAPGQTSPYDAPIFGNGTLVSDGSVQWMSLGTSPAFLGIPLGGTSENVTARSYFTSDRGLWSVEYLICKARARLRLRSRCVKIQWDAPFEDCLDLSLRKNATILDGRIPSGAATGKITSYVLSGTKDGKLIGHVVIGSSVGYGNSVPDVTGTPEYTAATGYMTAGYQAYDGGAFSIAEEDISYTKPVFTPFDDGLAFPLQFFPGVIVMTTPDQVKAVESALAADSSSFVDPQAPAKNDSGGTFFGGGGNGTFNSTGQFLQDQNPKEYALEAAPIACEIIIRPVDGGSFNGSIVVECSLLEIPQGINIAAD